MGWQPIETAPKDGTLIDLWADGLRIADCVWGKPDHCCGEAGQYCDSEWHGQPEGWVDTSFNEFLWTVHAPSHWMSIPAPPGEDRQP